MSVPRSILHVDMDAFFAAIEQLDHPELRGKPVLVGSDRPRGVVATASYEARAFGCHSAQPMSVARRLCPHAITVPVRGDRYRQVSRRMFAIFEHFTPAVEPLSVDEAFLDLTGTDRLFGNAETAARRLKQRIQNELGLPASVGIAPNKFLAKLASDLEKPDGLTIIATDDIDRVLAPLPITRIWGIGPATAARFEAIGLNTVGDLQRISSQQLAQECGAEAERFARLARGIDHRTVTPDSSTKSIGQEQTFEQDVSNLDHLRWVLLSQVQQIGTRLRRQPLRARRMTVKIRFGDYETITRSTTWETPTRATDDLWRSARALFDHWVNTAFVPVRLLGAAADALTGGGEQLSLFAHQRERQNRLDEVQDKIKERFGKRAIGRGLTPRSQDRR